MRIVALVLALAFAMAPPAAALEKMRIADAQLIALEPQRFVLRIQSTGPQAFDVVKPVAQGPGKVRVRLYRARVRTIRTCWRSLTNRTFPNRRARLPGAGPPGRQPARGGSADRALTAIVKRGPACSRRPSRRGRGGRWATARSGDGDRGSAP